MRLRPKDNYIEINGLRFHYLDWGGAERPVMLLLHGFMGHAHVWDDLAQKFRGRYHIIALDQRGHGESDWSKDAFYSIDAHYLDLVSFISSLDIKDLILIGHSMGGRNALFYTACHPEKVEKLVLIDVRPSWNFRNSLALKNHIRGLPFEANSLTEAVRAIKKLYPRLPIRVCRHLVFYGYRKIGRGKFIPRFDLGMSLKLDRLGCITEDLRPYLKNITCPTLIIRGEKSAFLSKSEARKMCGAIKNATLKEIPFSSHMPVQENLKAFRRALSDFLN